MGETAQKWAMDGRRNVFGRPLDVVDFRMEPSTACQLITTFTADNVIPAEKTANDALAFAIRSKDGLLFVGFCPLWLWIADMAVKIY